MDWRNPKDPLNVPKAVRLRDRAGVLKSRADALLRQADALLAEAQALEDAAQDQKRAAKPRPDPEFQVRVSPKGSISTRKLFGEGLPSASIDEKSRLHSFDPEGRLEC